MVLLYEVDADEIGSGAGVDHDRRIGCDLFATNLGRDNHVARGVEGGKTTRFI